MDQHGKAVGAPGFTLIEILITIVVIVVGCLAILSLQIAAMRGSSQADNRTVAVFLAESEIERLKALDVEILDNEAQDHKATPVVEVLDRFGHEYIESSNSGLAYTRTVTYFPKLPTSLSNQVEVEVAWNDKFGEQRVFYTAIITSFSFSGIASN